MLSKAFEVFAWSSLAMSVYFVVRSMYIAVLYDHYVSVTRTPVSRLKGTWTQLLLGLLALVLTVAFAFGAYFTLPTKFRAAGFPALSAISAVAIA